MSAHDVRLRGPSLPPVQPPDTLAEWGVETLTRLVATDSQSDAQCPDSPTSDGQRRLLDYLKQFCERLALDTVTDDYANLVVRLPASPPQSDRVPKVALVTHVDTAAGTLAVPTLSVTPGWYGGEVLYPDSEELVVTVDEYPETEVFLRQDLLHGPGTAPIGLEDKLGVALVLTLARVLLTNPEVAHGELVLAFRPDATVGRTAPMDSLAQRLAEMGVAAAYTLAGGLPFEVRGQPEGRGDALATELVAWAEEAAAAMGKAATPLPLQETSLGPLVERLPVASLSTGCFAPATEKEFTSRQMVAQHVIWLTHLVQVIVAESS